MIFLEELALRFREFSIIGHVYAERIAFFCFIMTSISCFIISSISCFIMTSISCFIMTSISCMDVPVPVLYREGFVPVFLLKIYQCENQILGVA